jgi:NAD(P)-dependent dehydrogenase (short-subunit alcohol dehydrogenase family)
VSGFEGRHVVITGGDGALGIAVVAALVEAGAVCHLPIHGPPPAAKPPASSSPTSDSPTSNPTYNIDLTEESAVTAYYAGLPGLWASIHLAGGYAAKPITETSRSDLEKMLLLNLGTAFLCSREAIRNMRGAKTAGRIVNVGARVSEVPIGGAVAYSVSKAGVASLTRSLAVEVKDDGILVNAVLPSTIDTPANRAAIPKADHAKWPKTEELAQTILWLASPDNSVTSGALVPVFGRA